MPPASKRIALTGGIASGKSLAADYLAGRGVPVIDADAVVHQLLRDDAHIKAQIREAFGSGVFNPDGTVSRPALGAVVFADHDKRRLLEGWLHPRVRAGIEAFCAENADAPQVITVIPLLFESGIEDRYDAVWLLDTPPDIQQARLMASRGMTEAEALGRIRSQMPLADKRLRAELHPDGRMIPNTGTPEALYAQLDALLAATASNQP